MKSFFEKLEVYLPYLEDLQSRLFGTTIIFSVFFVLGFFSAGIILRGFVSFFKIDGVVLAASSPFQFANLAMDIAFFVSLLVCLPVIIYHLFSFTASALTKKEKKVVYFLIPVSLFLFLFGFAYSFMVLYYSFELLASLNESLGIKNIWDIGAFLSQIFMTSILLGILFEFPIILTLLIRIGFMKVKFLQEKRRIAVFTVFILASLLPPTDGLSLLAMVVPLIFLYEATIFININKTKCLD